MRGYIACGMTGVPLSNWPHFEDWQGRLIAAGWSVVSPTVIDEAVGMVEVDRDDKGAIIDVRTTDKFDYEKILKIDFLAIEACDAIILLPGWTKSNGAKRELRHAMDLGLQVFTAEEALNV